MSYQWIMSFIGRVWYMHMQTIGVYRHPYLVSPVTIGRYILRELIVRAAVMLFRGICIGGTSDYE